MNLYAPKYYQDFVCIAKRCKHSCCIGWEIDVDDATIKKYKNCNREYAETVRDSIDQNETPHFRLCEHKRCPHLNEVGLCKIILSLGEDYLCDICREHPRFYHDTVRGKEVGLGIACEEACRLILSSDDYHEMIEIEDDCICDDVEFDAIAHREAIFEILCNRELPYCERLRMIQAAYGVSLEIQTDDEWRSLLASLEYLDDAHKALFECFSIDMDTPKEIEEKLERALAYFVYRHCSAACDEGELRAALGFSLFCERLLASVAITDTERDIVELARIVSEELEYSEENTERLKAAFYHE